MHDVKEKSLCMSVVTFCVFVCNSLCIHEFREEYGVPATSLLK